MMMAEKETAPYLFVTGTDTEVGKTIASLGLIRALQQKGKRVMAFKPVAAGASQHASFNGRALNEDAFLLQQSADFDLEYDLVNPYLLSEPIAPHLAAAKHGLRLSAFECAGHIEHIASLNAVDNDVCLMLVLCIGIVPLF